MHEPQSLPYGGVYRGKAAFRKALVRVLATWADLDFTIVNYAAGGDEVIVHIYLSGAGARTGRSFGMQVLELWRLRDGKIVELRPFLFDSGRMAWAHGDCPPFHAVDQDHPS
ncbi:ketosteroid isomerase-like protein [Novosphingobium chloroacetimidivorans]|uniref:Ketosteroid isomerase-like protein n=1 Tax=Novosphingobium chloroacetimidivorans TaxID=1428314 RepID=A0A7W7NX25_9SPHN|nr:ketosteroid isomerase-like protein [Novosphingobium chloroacetimidivorans]